MSVLIIIYLLMFVESSTTHADQQMQSSSTYDISGMFNFMVVEFVLLVSKQYCNKV